MRPERMAEIVAWWVRRYTRDLPPPVARRRIDEIAADLHDHIAHERAHGTGERRIAARIAARMARGLAADASWRRRTIARPSTRRRTREMSSPASRSVLRVTLLTAFALLVPLVAMQVSDGIDWGVFDFVFAAVLLAATGALYELAMRRPGNVALRAIATLLGVAAIVVGEADDAPGLVLFGGLVIIGTVALAVRTAQRSA